MYKSLEHCDFSISLCLPAEQLIQSWLRDENNVQTFPPSSLGERTSHPLTWGHSLVPPATNITPSNLRHWYVLVLGFVTESEFIDSTGVEWREVLSPLSLTLI